MKNALNFGKIHKKKKEFFTKKERHTMKIRQIVRKTGDFTVQIDFRGKRGYNEYRSFIQYCQTIVESFERGEWICSREILSMSEEQSMPI